MSAKIVIAPDSFKECLAAEEVASAMAEGVRAAAPEAEVVCVPMADGGEGTVRALVAATGGTLHRATVTGPLGEPVEAEFGILGDATTAVIEMAAASGLPLVPPDRRDPAKTTTFGTGALIRAALDLGAGRLLLGIGGSATVDGGAGMAQALGIALLDEDGQSIGRGGGELERLARIDVSNRDPGLDDTVCEVACDVDNPLVGPHGAARVYGPQKGATPQMVKRLDANLAHLAEVVERDLGVNIRDLPGAGAAGGLGAGLVAFLGATLRPGVSDSMESSGSRRQNSPPRTVRRIALAGLSPSTAMWRWSAQGGTTAGLQAPARRTCTGSPGVSGSRRPSSRPRTLQPVIGTVGRFPWLAMWC